MYREDRETLPGVNKKMGNDMRNHAPKEVQYVRSERHDHYPGRNHTTASGN